jgi:hypothetical protein
VGGQLSVWEVRLVYRNGDRGWENVWHVDAGADTDVDPALLLAFQDFGLGTLLSIYSLQRIARRPVGTSNEFIDIIIDGAGGLPIGSNVAMPLFNVIRLLLEGGVGRPGLKLLRGALVVADVVDSQNHISSTLRTVIENAAIALFNAASDAGQSIVIGDDARVAVSPSTDSQVQERQLHRKRRRTA